LTNGRRSRCASQKMGGGCTKRRPVLDVHDVKQQRSHRSRACPRSAIFDAQVGKPDLRAPFARAKRAARMHGNPVRSMRAQPQMRTRERTLGSCRSVSSGFKLRAHRVPPACVAEGFWPAAG
jgi:hypothetical protein